MLRIIWDLFIENCKLKIENLFAGLSKPVSRILSDPDKSGY